jgi:hypothetical protein
MNSFTRIKGDLQPLLERFSDENLGAIEDVCINYLLSTSLTDADSARANTGVYLILKLAGQIRELWADEQPMRSDRLDVIRDGAWQPFKRFAEAVLADFDSETLFVEFQEALRSAVILT